MRRVVFAALLLLAFVVISSAQQQAPPAPLQNPRQALIEMVSGDQNAVFKHLTVEVQQLLKQPEYKEALLSLSGGGSLNSMGLQFFESGPVLASFSQPSMNYKIEVQINNDDMSGDQDTLDLSLHSFRDGVEEDEDWQSLLSHLSVTMVRQQNLWRLSKIGVGVDLAIGDPEFLKKTYLKQTTGAGVGMAGGKVITHTSLQPGGNEPVQLQEMPPGQIAFLLGIAEQSFARQHADVGFTCSLSDLVESGMFGLDPQIASGSYKTYKIALTGCQGKPVGSFQIIVEPMPGKGGKAYCTDATQNVRASDDGRGATCLNSGRLEQRFPDEADSVRPEPETTVIKPKD